VVAAVLLSERLRQSANPDLAVGPAASAPVTPDEPPVSAPVTPIVSPKVGQPKPFAVFQDQFQDGSAGPKMVALPAGDFQMGSPETEPERNPNEQQHQVRIAKPFAIGQTEVTFDDYDRFAKATKRDLPQASWGRKDQPVISVSWDDATAYAAWLAGQTGKAYRLPTEAEWEYAARAGTTRPFFTGDCISTKQANYNGTVDYNNCGAKTGVYTAKTLPVGSFEANGWGLYDMAGNVWEWTCSAYAAFYDGKEQVCTRNNDAKPGPARVIRGGSWLPWPAGVRSAYRFWLSPSTRVDNLGFRLAQDL
jgi:formylglycine-generating enzyme required for sulfatase activity